MSRLHIRQGFFDAGRTLKESASLLRRRASGAAVLFAAFSLLPSLVRAALWMGAQEPLLAAWESWAGAVFSARPAQDSLSRLAGETMLRVGTRGLAGTMAELAFALLLTPLFLSSLALLHAGRAPYTGMRQAAAAVRRVSGNAKNLIVSALLCMLATWFAQTLPSIASGFLTAVAGLFSFIPLLGAVVTALSLTLSALLALATDFAMTALFAYVWPCAALEGVSGIAALTRSVSLTRSMARETLFTLLLLALFRLLGVSFFAQPGFPPGGLCTRPRRSIPYIPYSFAPAPARSPFADPSCNMTVPEAIKTPIYIDRGWKEPCQTSVVFGIDARRFACMTKQGFPGMCRWA